MSLRMQLERGQATVVKAGVLSKKGHYLKSLWAPRFFVLTPTALRYFKDKQFNTLGEERGAIPLSIIVSVSVLDDGLTLKLAILNSKPKLLRAETQESCAEWAEAIRKTKNDCWAAGHSDPPSSTVSAAPSSSVAASTSSHSRWGRSHVSSNTTTTTFSSTNSATSNISFSSTMPQVILAPSHHAPIDRASSPPPPEYVSSSNYNPPLSPTSSTSTISPPPLSEHIHHTHQRSPSSQTDETEPPVPSSPMAGTHFAFPSESLSESMSNPPSPHFHQPLHILKPSAASSSSERRPLKIDDEGVTLSPPLSPTSDNSYHNKEQYPVQRETINNNSNNNNIQGSSNRDYNKDMLYKDTHVQKDTHTHVHKDNKDAHSHKDAFAHTTHKNNVYKDTHREVFVSGKDTHRELKENKDHAPHHESSHFTHSSSHHTHTHASHHHKEGKEPYVKARDLNQHMDPDASNSLKHRSRGTRKEDLVKPSAAPFTSPQIFSDSEIDDVDLDEDEVLDLSESELSPDRRSSGSEAEQTGGLTKDIPFASDPLGEMHFPERKDVRDDDEDFEQEPDSAYTTDGYSSDSRWGGSESETSGTISPLPLHERPISLVTVIEAVSATQREVILARNARWDQPLLLGPSNAAVVTLADGSSLNITEQSFVDPNPQWMDTEPPIKPRQKRKWRASEVLIEATTSRPKFVFSSDLVRESSLFVCFILLSMLFLTDQQWSSFVSSTQARVTLCAVGTVFAFRPLSIINRWAQSRHYSLKLCESRSKPRNLKDLKSKIALDRHEESEHGEDLAEESDKEGSVSSQRSRIEKASILAQYPTRKSFLGRSRRDIRSDRVWAKLSLEDMHVESWGGWMEADPGLVLLKQPNAGRADIAPCAGFLLGLKHVDVFTCDYKLFNVASLSHSYHQTTLLSQGGPPTLVINFLFPGTPKSPPFNCVAYFQLPSAEKRTVDAEAFASCKRFFDRFKDGSDEFKTSAFKVVPRLPYGNWLVRGAIRKGLSTGIHKKYFSDPSRSYLEIDIDLHRGGLPKKVLNMVKKNSRDLIIDISFFLQVGPPCLLGGYRLVRVDVDKAASIRDILPRQRRGSLRAAQTEIEAQIKAKGNASLPLPSRTIHHEPWGGWSEADASLLNLRPHDDALPYLFRLAHVDVFSTSHKLYHVASRSDSYAQTAYIPRKRLAFKRRDKDPAFTVPLLVINLMVPSESHETVNMVVYLSRATPEQETPREAAIFDRMFDRFLDGSDAFRTQRFKMYSRIPQGSWIVKQGVKKAILSRNLSKKYFLDVNRNYFEIDVDVGSSHVASRLFKLVKGHASNLTIDISFGFEIAKPEETELPECLLGGVRLVNLNISQVKGGFISLEPEKALPGISHRETSNSNLVSMNSQSSSPDNTNVHRTGASSSSSSSSSSSTSSGGSVAVRGRSDSGGSSGNSSSAGGFGSSNVIVINSSGIVSTGGTQIVNSSSSGSGHNSNSSSISISGGSNTNNNGGISIISNSGNITNSSSGNNSSGSSGSSSSISGSNVSSNGGFSNGSSSSSSSNGSSKPVRKKEVVAVSNAPAPSGPTGMDHEALHAAICNIPVEKGMHSVPWGEWGEADWKSMRVRSKSYVADKVKQAAGDFSFHLAHLEMFATHHKLYKVAMREGCWTQTHFLPHKRKVMGAAFCDKYPTPGPLVIGLGEEPDPADLVNEPTDEKWSSSPLIVLNLLFPGVTNNYNLICYFTRKNNKFDGLEAFDLLLDRFLNGSDEFRTSRFKLIPSVPDGPWLVKKTVGTTPAILGNKLTQTYFEDPNKHFFEIDVDVGSSKVGGGILSMVKGSAKVVIVDLCFLFEAQDDEELPECLLGGLRLAHPDITKCLFVD